MNQSLSPTAMPATIALWRGAHARGESGANAAHGFVTVSAYELCGVPDFSSKRFPDLSQLEESKRISAVSELQRSLLTTLHALGPNYGFTLRYAMRRDDLGEPRVRVFVIGRCFGETATQSDVGVDGFHTAFEASACREYVWRHVPAAEAQLDGIRSIVELLRPENRVPAWHRPQVCGFRYYYVPGSFAFQEHDMIGVCRALTSHRQSQSLYLDCTLTPTNPLTEAERAEVVSWRTLAEKWSRDQKVIVPSGVFFDKQTIEIEADPNAGGVKSSFEALERSLGSPSSRLFLMAVRLMSVTDEAPLSCAAAVGASCVGAGAGFHCQAMDASHSSFARALAAAQFGYVTPSVYNAALWNEADAPETLRRLHRMVDASEASAFFRLPIPGRDGCPGIPLDSGVAAPKGPQRGDILIGNVRDGSRTTTDEAGIGLNDLAKHSLIVGTPGSGKTTLCFSLLTQIAVDHGVPFMVLEPAKTEYRALGTFPGLGNLLVFTVGNERAAPFRFNPLEVPNGIAVSEHISTMSTCFSGAFSLWDPLPMILEEALRNVYAEKGFSEYEVGGESPELEWPTLADLYAAALRIAADSSYRGETAGNIRGALEARLGALLRGPKGRCFCTGHSVPIRELLSRPVVLELDALNDNEKALTMMFLLSTVRAHAKATRRSGSGLSHVLLVEEAHNVIGRGDSGGSGEGRANPKEVAIRFFTRMLAEMRALGEGVVIADQLPTAIAPEAVKSTNLKVMHRVVSADDREELGRSMLLDAGQMELAAQLGPGQSLVFREGWPRSQSVQEPDFKQKHNVEVPPTDLELRDRMTTALSEADLAGVYRPYEGCASSCTICDARVREQAERWVDRKMPTIRKLIADDPKGDPSVIAFTEFCDGLDVDSTDKVRWNCYGQHFWKRVKPMLAGAM